MTLSRLQRDVDEIKARNLRVEAEKAWETSWTRRGLILVLTYAVLLLVFLIGEFPKPWLSALVPTLGFFLSTLSIPIVKRFWLRRQGE